MGPIGPRTTLLVGQGRPRSSDGNCMSDLLDGFLRVLESRDGSALQVKGGSPPRIGGKGARRKLDAAAILGPEATAAMAASIMRPAGADPFDRRNEADFA